MDLSSPYAGPLYAFVAGILTSASPCALAAIPLVIGHMAGAGASKRDRVLDLTCFIAGMALALTLVGMVAGALGKSLVLSVPWIRWAAGFAFIAWGVSCLGFPGGAKTCSAPLALGKDTVNGAPASSGGSRNAVGGRRDAVGGSRNAVSGSRDTSGGSLRSVGRGFSGLLLGALYGLSASPCATPALLSILPLAATTGSAVRGAVLLFAYSAGQAVLVAAAGLATSRFQSVLGSRGGAKAVETLRKLGGVAIAGFGVYLVLRPYI